DQMYSAIKGGGAYVSRNGGEKVKLPFRKEGLRDLSTCLVAVEWGSDRSGNNFELKKKVFGYLAAMKEDGGSMVHSLRSIGSAALALAAVAAGVQDIYWEGGWYVACSV